MARSFRGLDRAAFEQDGVICVRAALGDETIDLARTAYDWSLENKGPGVSVEQCEGGGTFDQDRANPAAFSVYEPLVNRLEFLEILDQLFGPGDKWFMYEQVFRKSGGATRRTPWHQDTSYLPCDGDDLAVLWISFGSVPKDEALEFVRGSHRGALFDGSRFDPKDDTAPLYGDGTMPRLPNIEASRGDYPIVSWATEPGDVIVFHPSILHGGAPTGAGRERQTLSLRFFGERAVTAERPDRLRADTRQAVDAQALHPNAHPLTIVRSLPGGTPFRHKDFPKLRAL